jgi:dipeptidyl aminopeptidase/acylaminoacyl peptidase
LPCDALVFTRGNGLFAARLGRDGRALRGEQPVPVLEGLQVEGVHLVSQYAVADNGTLVYVAGDALDRVEIVSVDRAGGVRPLPVLPRSLGALEASPDGRHLAIILYEESYQVLLVEVDTGRSRVLVEPELANSPVWSPDGSELLFTSRRHGRLCAGWSWRMFWLARLVHQAPEDAVRLFPRCCCPTVVCS